MKIHRSLSIGIAVLGMAARGLAAPATVTTLIGTGAPGFSESQVNNPTAWRWGRTAGSTSAIWITSASGGWISRPKSSRPSRGTARRGTRETAARPKTRR